MTAGGRQRCEGTCGLPDVGDRNLRALGSVACGGDDKMVQWVDVFAAQHGDPIPILGTHMVREPALASCLQTCLHTHGIGGCVGIGE